MMIASVVGARPQFVKLAPISSAVRNRADVEHVIIHTGQHYDTSMSEAFFEDLSIPSPDLNLGVGSGSHAVQTARMMEALEPALAKLRPDCVLVYGDTNSTLAAALVSVKLRLPLAHLEAGLRSFNRDMPEEHNRVLTDHAADLLLAPTETAMQHLSSEGLAGRAQLVGDVMADVCLRMRDQVREDPLPASLHSDADGYVLATIHRAENTDHRERLAYVVDRLTRLDVPVVLAAHPRLASRLREFGLSSCGGSLRVVPPLGYPQLVRALLTARGVITDSGGLQKEAYLLGVPCTTIRGETEWTETLEDGWNVLDPHLERLQTLAARRPPTVRPRHGFGGGRAAVSVVDALRALGTT